MYFSFSKEYGKYKAVRKLVYKKFKRLIIPYLLIRSFFILIIQIIFGIDSNGESYLYRVIDDIIFAKSPGNL
ncbi:hypothetical protein [Clostridium tertium]|uniref:hypothetical protein n=1 Tax=Clostridium tertium TaxID=1559 RepID=UPI0024B379FB|nr:hypothetical protein [Clostridium tertium]MDI9217070.1 hypothetical protein [Clostridium tertium]